MEGARRTNQPVRSAALSNLTARQTLKKLPLVATAEKNNGAQSSNSKRRSHSKSRSNKSFSYLSWFPCCERRQLPFRATDQRLGHLIA